MSGEPLVIEVSAAVERRAREIAREEIASLCGLVLRRSQDDEVMLTRSLERNVADEVVRERFAVIFGELLRDFGGTVHEPDSLR